MGNKVTVKVEGMAELRKLFQLLPAEVKRGGIVIRSLRVGARMIRDEARRLAPVLRSPDPRREAGAIRAAIVEHPSKDAPLEVVVRVRSRGYIFSTGPDTRKNARNPQRAGNPNYWWLVEFGTSKMRAMPFMRPAFESQKVAAAKAIVEDLAPRIVDTAMKLARKVGLPQ